ncbi:MAG: CHAT domain-containing tetratricopeptide repeat protein [Planctomycetota bacterium]
MDEADLNPEMDDAALEVLLRRAGRQSRQPPAADCPSSLRVLDKLCSLRGQEPDEEVAAHLAACPTCLGLALSLQEADREVRASKGDSAEPPAWVAEILRAPPPAPVPVSRLPHLRRRPWIMWAPLAAAGLAVGITVALLMLGPPARAQSLLGLVVPQTYQDRPLSGSPGEGVHLRISLKQSAHTCVLLSYTLGAGWVPKWLDNSYREGPVEYECRGSFPEGTLRAHCLVVASLVAFSDEDRGKLRDAAPRLDHEKGRDELEALTRRCQADYRVLTFPAQEQPPRTDHRGDFERCLAATDPGLLRSWVEDHCDGAAALVATLLEEAVQEDEPAPHAKLENAAHLAQVWEEVAGSGALVERVACYKRWLDSPEELEKKRQLDCDIRREKLVCDDNSEFFWFLCLPDYYGEIPPTYAPALAAWYREQRVEYQRLGDAWGEIECLLREAWNSEEGRQRFREATELSESSAYPRGKGLGLFGLAYTQHKTLGTPFERVAESYREAWRLLDAIELWEAAAFARANLALDAVERSLLGEAFRYLKEAATIQRREKLEFGEAITLVKLALAHQLAGRYEEALDLSEGATAMLEQLLHSATLLPRTLHFTLAKANWRGAWAALLLNDLDKATVLADRAWEHVPGVVPDPDSSSRIENVKARILLEATRYEEAIKVALRAARFKEIPYRGAQGQLTLGAALRKLGRVEYASMALWHAAKIIAKRGPSLDLAEVLNEMACLQEGRGLLVEALAMRHQWLRVIRRILDSPELTPADRASVAQTQRAGFAAGVDLAMRLQGRGWPDAAEVALEFMEGARTGFREAPGEPPRPEGETLRHLETALDDGVAWLEYLHGDKKSYVLFVRRGEVIVRELETPRKEVETLIVRLGSAISARQDVTAVARVGRQAYDALLVPIVDQVSRCPTLIISPDPAMPAVPFEALVAPGEDDGLQGPQYLVVTHSVAYAPSARALLRIRSREPGTISRTFLGIAGSERHESRKVWSGRAELDRIREVLGASDVDIRRGDQIDAGAFEDGRLSGYRYVHVAAPIYELSAIDLGESATTGEDRLVEVSEITSPRPIASELVVLSGASEAAAEQAGCWYAGGLAEAFLSQGAASVLTSLWGERDDATVELLASFYREIATENSKAGALRAAKLALLEDWSHPYYWARFILHGDPR